MSLRQRASLALHLLRGRPTGYRLVVRRGALVCADRTRFGDVVSEHNPLAIYLQVPPPAWPCAGVDPVAERRGPDDLGWWTVGGTALRDALERCALGADPRTVAAELMQTLT